jgi:hypothetical protein
MSMGGGKRIAVIVRDRQGEALRISGGLTLADDAIEVFLLDRRLDRTDPEVAKPLELVTDLGLPVYSNNPENGFTTLSLEEIAGRLLEYDLVVPY